MPVMERLEVFEFDYQSVGENSTEMTSDKRKVKFTPLKPGTTVVMMHAGGASAAALDSPAVKAGSASPPPTSISPSLPHESLSPPNKRRRIVAPEDNYPSAFNNNNVKFDNNNLVKLEGTAKKTVTMKYSTIAAVSQSDMKMGRSFSSAEASSSSSPSVALRVEDAGDGFENEAEDAENGADPSPKDNPDVYSKFSACHTTQMKLSHPELSADLIEAKLREQWDSMTDEEASWYIFNGVPPGKLLPGKKRTRPKSKFLEKLMENSNRRQNGVMT